MLSLKIKRHHGALLTVTVNGVKLHALIEYAREPGEDAQIHFIIPDEIQVTRVGPFFKDESPQQKLWRAVHMPKTVQEVGHG